MIPFKVHSSGESRFQNGFRQGVNSARIDCTMWTFQCIVKDTHKHFMSGEDVQLHHLEFLPYVLSILNPARSVASLHVSFKTVAQLSDYFNIMDISNREQCLCRIGNSSTWPEILHILDVLQRWDDNYAVYYWTCFDGSVGSDSRHSKLFRSNYHWKLKNRHYISMSSLLPGERPLETEQLTVSTKTEFWIIWVKHQQLRSQFWSDDAKRNHESPISELQVHLPTIFFSGTTENEIDDLLTVRFYSNVWITPSTSVTPHRFQSWFAFTFLNFIVREFLQFFVSHLG